MIEFTCAVCGKVKQVRSKWDATTYCSRSCASIARNSNRERIVRPTNGECIYQPESTDCDRLKCSACGWNPEVAKKRLEAIMEGLYE